MNAARSFRRSFAPNTRWWRINHINPRARQPRRVVVLKTTPQEAILDIGGESAHLEWPDRLGLTVEPKDHGWKILDPAGRLLLTYEPIADVEGLLDSILRA